MQWADAFLSTIENLRILIKIMELLSHKYAHDKLFNESMILNFID